MQEFVGEANRWWKDLGLSFHHTTGFSYESEGEAAFSYESEGGLVVPLLLEGVAKECF